MTISGDWAECALKKRDIVHVVQKGPGQPLQTPQGASSFTSHVDNQHNFLVVHPDILVTPSSVMSAVECDRR